MPHARDLLATAAERLAAAGVPSPVVDAELLLAHVTGRPRAVLRLSGADVPAADATRFESLVDRRARRVPVQHLTGRAPFRHLEVGVGPGTFIPRPETELIVDEVLRSLGATVAAATDERPAEGGPVVVDLCAGSAALALSLATELHGARVHGVELSADAHAQAARNLAEHAGAIAAVGSALTLHHADALTAADPGGCLHPLVGTVDVVVTNPPYVPDDAVPRDPEVRDHDPHMALYGGPDGLSIIRPLARQAALLLRSGGLLVIEHSDLQGEDAGTAGVPHLLRAHRGVPTWGEVLDHADLAGRPRFTTARLAGRRMGA